MFRSAPLHFPLSPIIVLSSSNLPAVADHVFHGIQIYRSTGFILCLTITADRSDSDYLSRSTSYMTRQRHKHSIVVLWSGTPVWGNNAGT